MYMGHSEEHFRVINARLVSLFKMGQASVIILIMVSGYSGKIAFSGRIVNIYF
jgi:hypothetical protein